jgi:DeoR family transcriptional regulator of aga operon
VSRYSRWNQLLELLAAEGQLQAERAAEVLGVSTTAIRRDFDALAGQRMPARIRGGAVAQGVTPLDPSVRERAGLADEVAARFAGAGVRVMIA